MLCYVSGIIIVFDPEFVVVFATLIPLITVHLGEPVTFTCVLPGTELSSRQLYWYKQSAGDTLKLIVTLWKSTKPEFTPEFSESRLQVNDHRSFINLTIVKTIQEDEGMYHCAIVEWIETKWSGTYLLVKGKLSDPVHPGESVTLQCSVLSDKTCSGDHSVYWFRAGSNKSHPNIIYTDGNKSNECEKKPDAHSPPKRCVYHFSKNVSSSDSGTYYCAVATCGEIIFGDGTKLEIEGNCIIVGTEAEDKLNYVALNFSERKATRGRKKREFAEDSVYSQVRC
uniref:Ig-like domain-containing protein n=1 Tax=Lates calcarifer TaxID=8187 RepID=A0A4W6FA23_LATCA